jgi:hypothetical protein
MAQLISITSEALQASIRRLLPSQQGFGEDLQASNVITPIIDLTPTAEGSALPDYLQTALAFDDLTAFNAQNGTATVANTPGFWRVFAGIGVRGNAPADNIGSFTISDGLSTKTIWGLAIDNADPAYAGSSQVDFVVCLSAGETLSAVSNGPEAEILGSARQIATINGVLVDPSGFTPQ